MATESREIAPDRPAKAEQPVPPAVDGVRKAVRGKVSKATRAPRKRETSQEEEEILKKAANYCLRTFPMLWTVGGIKEEQGEDGSRRWIVAVYLRYPIGHEGYLGDLLYDGQQITELTSRDIMRERSKQIAADPERIRQWNEYRASTSPAREG